MSVEPVPFQFPLTGSDTMGFGGARSTSYRVHGLLHFDGATITIEWTTTSHVEHVSLTRVQIEDDASPATLLDVPLEWIAEARLVTGWWRTRILLRARRLDAFEGLPGAGPGTLTLRIARRDRAIAAAMVDALAAARTLPPAATAYDSPELNPGGQAELAP